MALGEMVRCGAGGQSVQGRVQARFAGGAAGVRPSPHKTRRLRAKAPAPHGLFVVVGGLSFRARSHGNDDVHAFFVVKVFDAKLHMVLLDAELSLFADRQ